MMTPSVPEWCEQYDRMKRWQARIADPARPVDEHYVDDCYAFFTCCFHLKDWLQEDSGVPATTRDQAERYVKGNLWLRLCADLANGSKHMILDERRRYDDSARVEITGALDLTMLRPMPLYPVAVVQLGAETHDARKVADRCVAQCETFLRDHSLLD